MEATERPSHYNNLEEMSINELLVNINKEDQTVPIAVSKQLHQIEALIIAVVPRMEAGGRLFYIGSGTSGRLGILDASECPPTYGVPEDMVVGIIAGGDAAIRKATEHAEDDVDQAWKDLLKYEVNAKDTIIGIAASGKTPYVVGGVQEARKNGLLTACITCNKKTKLAAAVEIPVEVVVGPEFVTGSTRMKAGTAQKLVLNMISTAIMIRLGRVQGNKMVDMKLSNNKLLDRGTRMIMDELLIDKDLALTLLKQYGSVRKAVEAYKSNA